MSSLLRALTLTPRGLLANSFRLAVARPPAIGLIPLRSLSVAPNAILKAPGNSSSSNQTNLRSLINDYDEKLKQSGRVDSHWLQKALSLIETQGSIGGPQVHVILRATGSLARDTPPSERDKLTDRIWSLTNKNEIDISHYNTLLQVKLDNGANFDPLAMLQEITSVGMTPNRVTYQRLVQRYCEIEDINGASKIIEFMKSENIAVSNLVFHSLIDGHLRKKDDESAFKILEVMKSAEVPITLETYTVLARGLLRLGKTEAAFKILDEHLLSQNQILSLYKEVALSDNKSCLPNIIEYLPVLNTLKIEIVNSVIELISLNRPDEAVILFEHLNRMDNNDGSFIFTQMARVDYPLDKVVELSRKFKEKGINSQGLLASAKIAISTKDKETGKMYINSLFDEGYELRPHYFLPLICKSRNDEELFAVIKLMRDKNSVLLYDLAYDFVSPRIKEKDPNQIFRRLTDCGISERRCNTIALLTLIFRDKWDACEDYLKAKTRISDTNTLGERLLAKATPSNLNSIVAIVAELVPLTHPEKDIIVDLLSRCKRDMRDQLVQLIRERSLPLLKKNLTHLQNIGYDIELLKDRAVDKHSGNKSSTGFRKFDAMTTPELESTIADLESKQLSTSSLQAALIVRYCKENDIAKVEATLPKLPAEELTDGALVSLMSLYAQAGNFEKTFEFFKRIAAIEGFRVDQYKAIQAASLLIENDKLPEAKVLLGLADTNNYPSTNMLVNGLIDLVARKCGVPEALEIIENFVLKMTSLKGPSAGKFLANQPLDKALELFNGILNKFDFVLSKNLILKRIIKEGTPEQLEMITQKLNDKFGIFNANIDFGLAYLECGNLQKAAEYVQHISGDRGVQRLSRKLNFYLESGDNENFEALLKLMLDAPYLRKQAVDLKIKSLVIQGETQKALQAWTDAQEMEIVPSDAVMCDLAKLLQNQGLEVPFVVPGYVTNSNVFHPSVVQTCLEKVDKLAEAGNFDEAFQTLKTIPPQKYRFFIGHARFLYNKFLKAAVAAKKVELLEKIYAESRDNACGVGIMEIYINDNRVEDYFKLVENTPVANISHKALTLFLTKYPEFLTRARALGQKAVSEDDTRVSNAVWNTYFLQSKFDLCQKMLAETPQLQSKLMIFVAPQKLDPNAEHQKQVIEICKSCDEKQVGRILSAYTIGLLDNEKTEEAHNFLKFALSNNLSLVNFSQGLYQKLKSQLTLTGNTIDFELPRRRD